MPINPVILAGGSGTRLWPLSREHYPKTLLGLAGDRSLLQQTVLRLEGSTSVLAPLMVCNEEHRFLAAEQLRQIGKAPREIILEPEGRNTAPALTVAALSLLANGGDTVMLVMPADHVIQDVGAFHKALEVAASLARAGKIVTFGIVPTAPETGYGYIELGRSLSGTARDASCPAAHEISGFVEKPDVETAQRYLASGKYLWNSGMFVMRASVWNEELGRHHPGILRACQAAYEQGGRDGDFYRVQTESFLQCPSDSIDRAVVEKTDRAVCVPLEAGWSDVGAWPSLWDFLGHDERGNVVRGDVYVHATRNSMLIAQHRLLAVVGCEDVIVVEAPDAVLVARRYCAQDVKEIVNRLKADRRSERLAHRRVYRPWGHYEGIDAGERFQVKRLRVKPGAALSLQAHRHRAEHWVVVKGTARVTRGDETFVLTENQSTYIPVNVKHRLENPGDIPLEIIEVQSGAYLGEDDIVRFDDLYNRH